MVRVSIYVEGGGDSKELHTRCREGFRKLIAKAGFANRMPAIIACGGRDRAFDMFKTAVCADAPNQYPMLLVDSEDPVDPQVDPSKSPDVAWYHLELRDNWNRPHGAKDDQAQLMATCMETWIISDRVALRKVFGACLQKSALLPIENLEQKSRHDVQQALENATRRCERDKAYRKGKRSFQVLAALTPDTLRSYLYFFKRFIESLETLLSKGES